MKNKNPAYDKPFNTFIRLYDGNYKKLLLSFIFFVIKHSPVWIMPIVLSNLINIISNTQDLKVNELIINLGLMAILVITNVPATLIHTRFMSLAIRDVESSVRIKLVKKLQVLSIPYHKHLSGGKLQSKVLRDVELITNLSNVICITVVPIILNVIVAFSVTTTRNVYVSLFFLAIIPIAVFFIGKFNGSIQSSNKILRKNIEDMSTAVSQMVEMVPQNTVLFSGSIKDNITYGMDVSNEKLDEIIDAACLREVIERLPDGIDTNIGEHGDMLSGGQKQRISIARALIRNPKVIMDRL